MKIGKYECNSLEHAQSKIDAFGMDDEGNPTHNHAFVMLGYNVLQEATYDDEGNVLTEAVYGDKYMVDAYWRDLEQDEEGNVDHPYGWKSYSIDIDDEGLHSFYGIKYQDLKIQ